jgi:hypothetical protein
VAADTRQREAFQQPGVVVWGKRVGLVDRGQGGGRDRGCYRGRHGASVVVMGVDNRMILEFRVCSYSAATITAKLDIPLLCRSPAYEPAAGSRVRRAGGRAVGADTEPGFGMPCDRITQQSPGGADGDRGSMMRRKPKLSLTEIPNLEVCLTL